MDRSQLLSQVTDVIVDQLPVDASKITENTSFVDDLDADSLDFLQLVTAMEDEFGITIEDEVFENVKTVGDAMDHIEELLK